LAREDSTSSPCHENVPGAERVERQKPREQAGDASAMETKKVMEPLAIAAMFAVSVAVGLGGARVILGAVFSAMTHVGTSQGVPDGTPLP
jgi:hypothetical protein